MLLPGGMSSGTLGLVGVVAHDAAPVLGQHRQDEPVVELPVQRSVP